MLLSPHLLVEMARTLVRQSGRRWEDPGGAAPPLPDAGAMPAMAFIQRCGYWSHYDHSIGTSAWAIPSGLTTNALGEFGRAHGLVRKVPQDGDIFVLQAPRSKLFVHAGIVLEVLDIGRYTRRGTFVDVYTAEADTDGLGRIGKGERRRVRRRLSTTLGDRFIRWTELEPYDRHLARVLAPLRAELRRPA